MAPAPETQHLPIPRATTAACDVIPPRAVRMPSALAIPARSSGDVSIRTIITLCPLAAHSCASSAWNTICPQAAPGEAGSPCVMTLALERASLSNTGWRSSSSFCGSQRHIAVFSSMSPSFTRSMAIFTIAVPVRLPLRVCRNQSLPSCTVNSMSCMS